MPLRDVERFLSPTGRELHASAIRRMGTVAARQSDLISFAAGYPAPDLFPLDELREIPATLLSGGRDALQYGPTRGHAPLIDALANEMARRHVPVTSQDLLVTTGSQQGLDLVARVLVGPDDAVLVEAPTFTGAISAFGNARPRWIAGVRQDGHGIDLDDLERIAICHPSPVRPVGSECVVAVNNSKYPGANRNLCANQAVRITGAVPILVMVANDGLDRIRKFDR